MLNVFSLANGRLFQEEIESLRRWRASPIWVDLDAPTPEEKGWIAQHYGLSTIPQDVVDEDLEESARFYEEDNGELHIRPDFLIDDDERSRNVRVAFIPYKNVLFSVHGEELPVFRLLRLRARRIPALIEDAKDVLLKLYDADAEYSADALEGIYDSLEAVRCARAQAGRQRPDRRRGAVGHRQGGRPERPHPPQRDGHAPRGQLHDAQPAAQRRAVRGGAPDPARHRLADSHTTFLFDKINFLMNATVGFININQNKIIKIFGGQRRAAAADADRQHLRHELPGHAGAELELLPVRAGADDRLGGRALHLLPP